MTQKKKDTIKYPTVFKRLLTVLVDFLFMLFISYHVKKLFGITDISKVAGDVLFVALWIVYEAVLTTYSCTLGQYFTRVRVRNAEDITKKISIAKSFIRVVVKLSLGIISLVLLLVKKDSKAFHDKFAQSQVYEPEKGEIKTFMSNPWVKFSVIALLYTLWVIWLGNFIWLLGLGVIFDMYITKKVPWDFWNLFKSDSNKSVNMAIEWFDAIVFAVIAASFIRMFFIELYTIPTSSMEKSLLIGDYLFVSKYHYGPRTPNTPIAFPFVHHTMPFTEYTPSFSTIIQNDYKRLASLEDVERDDAVVFNFPEGDTVIAEVQNQSYYQVCRDYGRENVHKRFTILARPVDKRENYIKRCVAIPGDTLFIDEGNVYINGKPQEKIDGMQYDYYVYPKTGSINSKVLTELGISDEDIAESKAMPDMLVLPMTDKMAKELAAKPFIKAVDKMLRRKGEREKAVFPHDERYMWNRDFFGPLVMPKKGVTIELTLDNLPLYRRLISLYEANDLKVEGNDIFINGEKVTEYTFKMDYYWMMGDNRHNSQDSRYWGFVPEDHIVGKPVLVLISTDKDKKLPFPFNLRWERTLKVLE